MMRTNFLGSASRRWLFAVILSSFVPHAAAFHYYGDDTTNGILGTWAAFTLIYIACTILAIVLLSRPTSLGHRTPFSLLLTASIILFIMALAQVVLNVMHNIDTSIEWRVSAALEGVQSVALFCALALEFLAIAFVANDRYECAEEAYKGYSGGKKHPLRLYSFACFLVILGLGGAAGGLWAWYLMSATSRGTRYNIFRIVAYAAGAVFTISGILAITQAAVTFKRMSRAGVIDKATKLLTYAIAPSYFCASAATFAYYLVTNIIEDWTSSEYNRTLLIFWVVINFFVSLTLLGLLILGMRGRWWFTDGSGSEVGNLAGHSPVSTPKPDGNIANAFPQPQLDYNPNAQSVYAATATLPENAPTQFSVDSRPLSYFSANSGSNVRPDTTYTYVGEVDSMLRGTAYGQAMQQQQYAPQRMSPPSQTGSSPPPIVSHPTGSSLPSVHTQATYPTEQPPIGDQIRYRY